MTNYPQKISNFLLDTIFPIRCISCHTLAINNSKDYLCKKCLKLIPINSNSQCINCNKPSPTGETCRECREYNSVDNLLILSDYKNSLVEKIIKMIKYRFIAMLALSLTPVIKKYIINLAKKNRSPFLTSGFLIIPVPLHKKRLNYRGFNQAEIFGEILSNITLLDYSNTVLIRVAETKPQADIQNKEDRIKNIQNVFKLTSNSPIKNRNILLVDDVCTTGATLNQAARILKEAGARSVTAFVIARG